MQGYCLLTAQAHFPHLRPAPCKGAVAGSECEAAERGQEAILYVGIYLIAVGASGVKVALPALGADQFDDRDPGEAAKVSSFFNWFMFSLTIGSIVGVTLIAWLNTEVGWDWAFVVCSIALLAAIVIVFSGKSFYRNNVPIGSPLLRLLQVPIFLLLSSISILFSNIFSNTTNYLVKINPNILLFLLYIQLGKFVSFISR